MDFNILIGEPEGRDLDLFDGDPVERMDSMTMPQLLRELGLIKSLSQVKGSKYWGDIPDGWSDFTYGKRRDRICILKKG